MAGAVLIIRNRVALEAEPPLHLFTTWQWQQALVAAAPPTFTEPPTSAAPPFASGFIYANFSN